MPSLDIDRLFDPERLQKTWRAPPVACSPGRNDRERAIDSCRRKLLQLLDVRFTDKSPLAQSLADLEAALSGGQTPSAENLIGQLQALEELIWSLELAQPEARK